MESKWSGSGGAGGGGDVFGPVSSTDNAVARFDGTTGDTLQNSPVTISDSGVITGATIDGDDNTVQDLPLSAIKAVAGDANEILRRDSLGAVVSGPTTIDVDGNINNSKTLDLRNDDDLSGGATYMVRMTNYNSVAGSHPSIIFQRSRASNADLQNGDEVGGLDFRSRFNSLTQTTAKIHAVYTGTGTTRLSDIVFQTSNGGAPAERMRIAADGKVTIAGDFEVQGTTTTINTQTLEVEDANIRINKGGTNASAAGAGLTVEGTGASTLATIQYDGALGSKWKLGASGSEDEVVTRTLAQTLTDKTINGSNNTITNVSLSTGVTGTLPVANGGTGVTSSTGSGSVVLSNSPTLVTPNLGTPSAATLTNATGLPVSTGISGLGSGVATFLATPSSANLRGALTDETGSGAAVFATGPTLDAPVVDNAMLLLHETSVSTPSSGRVAVYPKSDNRLYVLDSSGVETVVGSGAAGGFVNYITNPDAESSTTGWSTYADAAAATPADGTGGSPNVTWTRNTSSPIRGNADFAFAKDAANRQGQGVSFAFTLATTDRSKKCQISFDYDTSAANYAAGDMRVYVYDVTNATLITPQTVDIPRGTNTFVTTFDTTTSTSYRLILHVATTNASSYTVDFDNFVVNAGEVVQGAAISEWQSYTPTISNLGGGSVNSSGGRWRRVGSNMEISVAFTTTGTGSGASNVTCSIPSGYTIDSNALPTSLTSGRNKLGSYSRYNGSQWLDDANVAAASSTTLYFIEPGTAAVLTGADFPSGTEFGFDALIPIAEWAGSGTINLGPGAQVEYASNDGSGGTAAGATYTTGSVAGPNGSAFVAVNSTTVDSATRYRVNFQYPIQNDDVFTLELLPAGAVSWIEADGTGTLSRRVIQGATNRNYGYWFESVSSTSINVLFANNGYAPSATYDANGPAWSVLSGAGWRWRVRKAKASSPVGFGLAAAGTSGLVSSESTGTASVWLKAIGGADLAASATIRWTRVGKMVTVIIPATSASTANTQLTLSTTQTSGVNTWPTEITPARQHYCIYSSVSNTTYSAALIGINASGVCQLFTDMSGSNFTGSTVVKGVGVATTITYMLD